MKKFITCIILSIVACCCLVFSACDKANEPKDLKVTFNYGWETSVSQITLKEGELVSKPETPVRDGYEFAGWYENEKLEKEFDFSKPVNKNTTIYADWVSNELQNMFSWDEVEGGIKLSTVLGGAETILPQDLIIPRVIDGQKVVELESELFAGQCYPEPQFELTTVKIPYGIKKIGDYAFKDCYNIQSIEIPETVSSIGIGVFKLSGRGGALKSAVLPSTLATIPAEMFYNCDSLETVNIPSNVKHIESNAFYSCIKLGTIDLPTGLKTIGDSAFNNCSVLSNVELPNTLLSIGVNAFRNCYKNTLTTFPASLTTIGAEAYAFNLAIEYIDIPSTITTMGRMIFNRCDGAILRTTLAENAEGWDATWNRNITTIYDSANNKLSSGERYFIQDGCKYLIKTDTTDNHKYLSLEFCFKTDEKVELNTKLTFEGVEYAVEEISQTAFNRFIHTSVKKLIFKEGILGKKLTFSDNFLMGFDALEYIVLPSSTQPLTQRLTYNYIYNKGTIVYTNLTKQDIDKWAFREDTTNGGYFIPTIFSAGEWNYVNGEPSRIIAT